MKDGNKITLGSMYKRMQDYTQHAWHEDDRAFEAVLQIARDYESNILWFNKNNEAKWKKFASERSLDPTVDVRAERMRM